MKRSSLGISPVVATVILVAIAIVIAIAVAFWASGLVGIFTRFEKLEITAAVYDGDDVELLVRNTGSSPATIDSVYVNGRPGATFTLITDGDQLDVPTGASACDTATGLCDPGEYIVINIADVDGTNEWVSGVTYEVAVHTASGKLYPVAVLIP